MFFTVDGNTHGRKLKVSHLSPGLFVVLLVSAELSIFKSKHALASSQTATEDKLSPPFYSVRKQRWNSIFTTSQKNKLSLILQEKCRKPDYKVIYKELLNQIFKLHF